MAVKAVLRALLILALIISAHLIRPFSIKNITQHLLYSARSLRFALPVQIREKFDHADYLAVNLSNILFESGHGLQGSSECVTADFAFKRANVQANCDSVKSDQKQNSRKSASAKQALRIDPLTLSNLVAIADSEDFRMFELPPVLMFEATDAQLDSIYTRKLFPGAINSVTSVRSVEAALQAWEKGFEISEADLRERIACEENGAKNLWVVERSEDGRLSISVSACDDQKPVEPQEDRDEAP